MIALSVASLTGLWPFYALPTRHFRAGLSHVAASRLRHNCCMASRHNLLKGAGLLSVV